MTQHFIFDLDHTVIDSSHRQRLLPNGDLDLDHWLRVAKNREAVFMDRLLPLVKVWFGALAIGAPITIATARTMGRPDWDFLRAKGLRFNHAVYRAKGDHAPDALLKAEGLIALFKRQTNLDPARSVMYDDNESVRASISMLGVRCIDPVPINKRMAAAR